MTKKHNPYIMMHSTRKFYFEKTGAEMQGQFDWRDIMRGLSNIARFSGQISYTVLQHSICVSKTLPEELQLEGLLHDAHEAYLGDIVSPLKSLLPDYQKIENRINSELRTWASLPKKLSAEVKRADRIMLQVEAEYYLGKGFPFDDDFTAPEILKASRVFEKMICVSQLELQQMFSASMNRHMPRD